jgi:hypothetical protein
VNQIMGAVGWGREQRMGAVGRGREQRWEQLAGESDDEAVGGGSSGRRNQMMGAVSRVRKWWMLSEWGVRAGDGKHSEGGR